MLREVDCVHKCLLLMSHFGFFNNVKKNRCKEKAILFCFFVFIFICLWIKFNIILKNYQSIANQSRVHTHPDPRRQWKIKIVYGGVIHDRFKYETRNTYRNTWAVDNEKLDLFASYLWQLLLWNVIGHIHVIIIYITHSLLMYPPEPAVELQTKLTYNRTCQHNGYLQHIFHISSLLLLIGLTFSSRQ